MVAATEHFLTHLSNSNQTGKTLVTATEESTLLLLLLHSLAPVQEVKLSKGVKGIIRKHLVSSVWMPGNMHIQMDTAVHLTLVSITCVLVHLYTKMHKKVLACRDLSITVCPLVMGYISVSAEVTMHRKLQRFRGHC